MRLSKGTKVYLVALLVILIVPTAFAQATRTWVSGVGDDVNPCSRTAPCKTFAGAISKTAAGGEINAIDPGGFGAVTITKSITINGSEQHSSILASGTNGVIVNAAGITVTLRRLSINGAGTTPGVNGVRILAGSKVTIEECDILGFSNAGIRDERSAGGTLNVIRTVVRDNTSAGVTHGINVAPSAGSTTINVSVVASQSFGNKTSGIALGAGVRAHLVDSMFNGNAAGVSLLPNGFTTEAALDNVTIALNSVNGLELLTGGTARLTETTITNNTTNGINFVGGSGLSFGTNNVAGNGGNNGAGLVLIGTGQQ